MKKVGIFIGRMQPLHNAHLNVIRLALCNVDRLIIVLGSDCQAKTIKNPWTTLERTAMIRACLSDEENSNAAIVATKDYLYNDNLWLTALQSTLDNNCDLSNSEITLFGHDKDRSTFYLHLFPHWNFHETGNLGDIDATRVRHHFFLGTFNEVSENIPEKVRDFIIKDEGTKKFQELQKEYTYKQQYDTIWDVAPIDPCLMTTHAIVIKSGHILLIKRNHDYGNGLYSLPGGMVSYDKTCEDSCLNKLRQQTHILLLKDELRRHIQNSKIFDHPQRSLLGRRISNTYCIDLGAGKLPQISKNSLWMSLRDIFRNEEEFFEDHFHIINFFVSRF